MRDRLALLLLMGLFMPFVGKPVHVDDANFLVLAQAAAEMPWTPHAVLINWGGTTERAFDVLSNPPGIAWWLAPVSNLDPAWMHLWMLPWLAVAAVGAKRLGDRIAERGSMAMLLVCGSPIAVLAAHSLTPDLPLLACTLWGLDAVLDKNRQWKGALVVGFGAWFRYSAIALWPLVFAWPWLNGQRTTAWRMLGLAALPTAALMIHDAMAYEQVHLFAMTGFQSVSQQTDDMIHKAVASVAALGGAAALPILAWARPKPTTIGGLIGGGVGVFAAVWASQHGVPAAATVLSTAAGGASLAGACSNRNSPIERWLLVWLGLGLVFLLGLRFTAARYWIPFFAPAVLLPLKAASGGLVRVAVALTLGLSVLLAVDDAEFATTQAQAAERATLAGTGHIAGHWGFQHHLRAQGWIDVEDDQTVPAGQWIAESRVGWPQMPANDCFDAEAVISFGDPWPGLRVHTHQGGANIHGHTLAGTPPTRVFAPWSIGDDPMETLTLRRTCP